MQKRQIFQSPYDQTRWEDFLGTCLRVPAKSLLARAEALAPVAGVQEGRYLGNFTTGDKAIIGIFAFRLAEGVVQRRRVGLRQVLQPFTNPKYGAFDAAFAVFYDSTSWRFSFVCDLKGGETSARRFTYVFGDSRCLYRTAIERFQTLQSSDVTLATLHDAFNVEALSDQFFNAYKAQYQRFCEFVSLQRKNKKYFGKEFADWDEKTIRDYVKKLLGRIVFLQFLQKKGWMGVSVSSQAWTGGDRHFMQTLYEKASEAQKDDFLDKVLEPLFFECLNLRRAGDVFNTGIPAVGINGKVRVPYLNGGLFERDLTDQPKSVFPRDYFAGLFDLFSQYNFTIDENDPNDAEVGVDPEMLGKIFENLLEDNKDKGAFYTPKEIVQYMCRESLTAYLLAKCGLKESSPDAAKVRTLVQSHQKPEGLSDALARAVQDALKSVKVCDPAIGSGAFPMGLLNELYKCREALGGDDGVESPADIKKHIVAHSIYGVDIEKGAVDIARLRFWLAIVVDSDKPEPLPNLDYKIMQGNSLLESYKGVNLSCLATQSSMQIVEPSRNLFGEIEEGQVKFTFTQRDRYDKFLDDVQSFYAIKNHVEKQKVRTKIEDHVREHILYNIDLRLEPHVRECQDCEAALKSIAGKEEEKTARKILINQSSKPYQKIEAGKVLAKIKDYETRMDVAEQEVQRLKSIRGQVETLGVQNPEFFLWHTWFADVFKPASDGNVAGGFDIVIGNPPYIQLQNNHGVLADLYKPCGFQSFAKTGDIYCLFYERGWQLLRDGGHLCFITSNKWMRAGYGELLRQFLAKQTNPEILLDFAGQKVFDSATVDTNILLFEKTPKNLGTTTACIGQAECRKNLSDFVRQHSTMCSFTDSDSWVILNPIEQSIKRKIEAVGTPLKDWDIHINYGIKTGCNEAFIINGTKRDEILKNCMTADERERTDALIRPILCGKDIRRYGYNFANRYLIAAHNGIPEKGVPRIDIRDYPAVKKHLDTFWKQISKRTDMGDTPYNLRSCAYMDDFNQQKISWGNLALSASFSSVPEKMYVNAPSPMITPFSAYLLATLNSKLADWYIRHLGVTRNGGYFEYKPMFIERLPVLRLSEMEQKRRFPFLFLKGSNPNQHQDEVDNAVFELYGLTKEERADVLSYL